MNIWKISGWELFRRFGQKSKLSGFLGAERAHPARVPLFVIGNFIGIPYYTKSPTGQDFLLLPENGKEEQRWIKMIILL